ncbi:tetratricopeptide repeat protein [Pannus brasiliensis CCIBt3594]|uniref:Tetratricopeptide repeat protein n=1 Tax=Pannus brasiliensis CCIBt3594 TaxID=1427578 RepID=A0AAW9R091_9CHRO
MKSSLSMIERYTFGNAGVYYGNATGGTDSERLKNELLQESPERQRALITLATKQIETQERAARSIVASNIAGSKMISAQIGQQTLQMQSTVREVGTRISNNITEMGATISSNINSAADRMSSSIDSLGQKLSIELGEIRWQLIQQNQTLDKILAILQESRNNEARQLVFQGVRLYVNGQYQQAEERFLRALDYDRIDYQVLMNLGYIELHKNNSQQALQYFQEALSLPANLDNLSKARTLWVIARTHYARQDYQNALTCAERSLAFDSQSPKHLFTVGVYASLSNQLNKALNTIKRSIEMDDSLFTLAAIEPDLEPVRQPVLKLLGDMSIEIHRQVEGSIKDIQDLFAQIESYKSIKECPDFMIELRQLFDEVQKKFQNPSYSDCVYSSKILKFLKRACESANTKMPLMDESLTELEKLNQEKLMIEQKLTVQELQVQRTENKKSGNNNDNNFESVESIFSLMVAVIIGLLSAIVYLYLIQNWFLAIILSFGFVCCFCFVVYLIVSSIENRIQKQREQEINRKNVLIEALKEINKEIDLRQSFLEDSYDFLNALLESKDYKNLLKIKYRDFV